MQQQKREWIWGLGSLCHNIEHETAPPFVAAPQQRAFPKIRCDVTDRKASPDAPDLFFWILFWSSRPEHNQKPTIDTANRHCSLIPTRRKIAVFPQGGQSTAPLARGRSNSPTVRQYHKIMGYVDYARYLLRGSSVLVSSHLTRISGSHLTSNRKRFPATFIRNPQEARSARASATSYLRETRSKPHDFKGKLPRAIVRLRILAY